MGAIEFIWQKIIDAAEQGVSVLLVSHELGEVMELSDRILVMYNGGIAADLENTPELSEKTVGLYMLGGDVLDTEGNVSLNKAEETIALLQKCYDAGIWHKSEQKQQRRVLDRL